MQKCRWQKKFNKPLPLQHWKETVYHQHHQNTEGGNTWLVFEMLQEELRKEKKVEGK